MPRNDLRLHWGINTWQSPPEGIRPAGTISIDGKAAQTPFTNGTSVQIVFPDEGNVPQKIVFVLKEGEKWINGSGSDFTAQIKPPDVTDIVSTILEAESSSEHWSLFNRFIMALQVLEGLDAAGPPGMAMLLTWLRLSGMRQLDWYRNSNYQSKDIAHVQKSLAQSVADKARSAKNPMNRALARAAMATLPRGGGNGDDIRHGILNIMRSNGIKEGHRPGIEDTFLEQWHQKLHTNTTPEDITICEAYLAFLNSGTMDEFWRVAWERGNITPETLAKMDHPITGYPVHLPHLIGPFQHYLWILKTTHSGADLDVCAEMAKGSLDGELNWMIQDVLSHREEWWVPGKIVEVRKRLEGVWRNPCSRDVLLLDIALDSYFRLLIERTDKGSMSRDDLVSLLALVLENACIASESDDLCRSRELWRRVADGDRWSSDWAQLALAAADHTSLSLQYYMDTIAGLVQPHAEAFGKACSIPESYVLNFSEEVVRGLPAFVMGPLLKFLNPHLRAAAGVGPWQVVATGTEPPVMGTIQALPNMDNIQGTTFDQPTVLVIDGLTGNEDIPEGVTAVLTATATDVLSHIAIRARSQSVLLATCFDDCTLSEIKSMQDRPVEVIVSGSGDVQVSLARGGSSSPAAAAGAGTTQGSKKKKTAVKLNKKKSGTMDKWIISETDVNASKEHVVGGKSRNLAGLKAKLPADVLAPVSVALPYGSFDRVLASPENAAVAKKVGELEALLSKDGKKGGVPSALAQLRTVITTELLAPESLKKEVVQAAETAGLVAQNVLSTSSEWESVWHAIKAVWASKWTDRAWLSRRAHAIPDEDLQMAVLLQQIIPADYAFVLHTADPLSGAKGIVHGEVVVGMGEALVGNHPGRALSFTYDSTTPSSPSLSVACLPSKREAMFVNKEKASELMLIARSDSNGEDLEDFAGAGLYDSVPVAAYDQIAVNYVEEPLLWDQTFRNDLLKKIAEMGISIEKAFDGVPQDIEGVYSQGELYVVQSRPQI